MLETLRIDDFRGLHDLGFQPLSKINVLTGLNNSGKTSVLEALYLLFAQEQQLTEYPDVFRSAQVPPQERHEHFWKWLLPNGDLMKEADLHVTTSDKRRLRTVVKRHAQNANVLTVQHMDSSRGSTVVNVTNGAVGASAPRPWPRMQRFSPRLSNPVTDAEQFNKVQLRADGEERLLELLKVIEPRLRKLRYARITKEPLVYADVGLGTLIPASQMGQAFGRMLTLYMDMLVTGAEILLIDEVENGLHHSVYEPVWRGIAALADQQNTQVFVTTHSLECVHAAADAAPRGGNHGFSHHRLEQLHGVAYVNTSTEVLGAGQPEKIGQILRAHASKQDSTPA